MGQKEVIQALPKLIKLNPIVVKEVFNRLLGTQHGRDPPPGQSWGWQGGCGMCRGGTGAAWGWSWWEVWGHGDTPGTPRGHPRDGPGAPSVHGMSLGGGHGMGDAPRDDFDARFGDTELLGGGDVGHETPAGDDSGARFGDTEPPRCHFWGH